MGTVAQAQSEPPEIELRRQSRTGTPPVTGEFPRSFPTMERGRRFPPLPATSILELLTLRRTDLTANRDPDLLQDQPPRRRLETLTTSKTKILDSSNKPDHNSSNNNSHRGNPNNSSNNHSHRDNPSNSSNNNNHRGSPSNNSNNNNHRDNPSNSSNNNNHRGNPSNNSNNNSHRDNLNNNSNSNNHRDNLNNNSSSNNHRDSPHPLHPISS